MSYLSPKPPGPWLLSDGRAPVLSSLLQNSLRAVLGTYREQCCLKDLISRHEDLFPQGFVCLTRSFIQDSAQTSSPETGSVPDHDLKRHFLSIPSNLTQLDFAVILTLDINLGNGYLPPWEQEGYSAGLVFCLSASCWISSVQTAQNRAVSGGCWMNHPFLPECCLFLPSYFSQTPRTVVRLMPCSQQELDKLSWHGGTLTPRPPKQPHHYRITGRYIKRGFGRKKNLLPKIATAVLGRNVLAQRELSWLPTTPVLNDQKGTCRSESETFVPEK